MHLSWILPFVVCRLSRSRSDKVTAEKFFDPTVGVDTLRSEAFISVFAYEDLIRHRVEQVEKLLLLQLCDFIREEKLNMGSDVDVEYALCDE